MKEATAVLAAEGVARRDGGEVRRLYDLHYHAFNAYFQRRSSAANAPDLTAEVFLVAEPGIEDAPRGEETLLWPYRVAAAVGARRPRSNIRHACLDPRLRLVAANGSNEPGPQVVRRAEHGQVLEAARRLRPADQELLRLAAWKQLPHNQISRLLGCSVPRSTSDSAVPSNAWRGSTARPTSRAAHGQRKATGDE